MNLTLWLSHLGAAIFFGYFSTNYLLNLLILVACFESSFSDKFATALCQEAIAESHCTFEASRQPQLL